MTDQFFLMGLDQGADVSAAGNFHQERCIRRLQRLLFDFLSTRRNPANFIDCTNESGLKTVFATVSGADAAIVTS